MAIAAIHDPAMRVAMLCHGRNSTDAVAPITASAAMPPHSVPTSISTASRSAMTSGGESNPRAAPATSATGAVSQTGADIPVAAINPHSPAIATRTSFAGVSPMPHAIAPRPPARPEANAASVGSCTNTSRPAMRPRPSNDMKCAGASTGYSNPRTKPSTPANGVIIPPSLTVSLVRARCGVANLLQPTHYGNSARRKSTPAPAIAAPASRTATRPAGQRVARPRLMPHRWRSPVAITKPAENAIASAPGGSSAPWAWPWKIAKADRDRHYQFEHHRGDRNADLDPRHRHGGDPQYTAERHHPWKRNRKKPYRQWRQRRAPEADRHHRGNMIGPEQRVTEAPRKAARDVAAPMGAR